LLGIALRVVGVRTGALCRPLPELHHLSHGGGYAAGVDVAAVARGVFRALAVPGEVLVPEGLAEHVDHGAGLSATVEATRFADAFPFGHDVGRGGDVVLAHVLDFLLEAFQREGKAFRHILRVVGAGGGVGEDGLGAVVARNDDEAFTVLDVEDVVVDGATGDVGGGSDAVELDVSVALSEGGGAQELGTDSLCLLLVDRAGHEAAQGEDSKAKCQI